MTHPDKSMGLRYILLYTIFVTRQNGNGHVVRLVVVSYDIEKFSYSAMAQHEEILFG